jgi:hypothetical protein
MVGFGNRRCGAFALGLKIFAFWFSDPAHLAGRLPASDPAAAEAGKICRAAAFRWLRDLEVIERLREGCCAYTLSWQKGIGNARLCYCSRGVKR